MKIRHIYTVVTTLLISIAAEAYPAHEVDSATIVERTGAFASYMTRSSYGIYIVHYLVIATIGYFLKVNTLLSPLCIYILLTIAVYILSPLLYELLKRIPFIRWCVLGEKK